MYRPGIVAHHPVTQCLPIHAGLTSCLRPVGPIQSHRKGQKTTQNPRITFFMSQSPKLSGARVGGSAEMPLGLLAKKGIQTHRITTSSRSQPAPPKEARFLALV